ncbi:hypothetical protein [Prochlorococcus sp. MIT 1341]|uniref:hypothetical protein n=1 Tax=Prochlorococcus sp. MIT 1341 TaxID=3096221 RepID=UPI002A753EA5|nr:hypothetical protein [Prochlorococcus sp. MIT 1341]
MTSQKIPRQNSLSCDLPRKQQAIEALLGLAWRKEKKKRPEWLMKELSGHC